MDISIFIFYSTSWMWWTLLRFCWSSEWCSTRYSIGASSIPNVRILIIFLANCRLYADDCILYRQIETKASARILQNDLGAWRMGENMENETYHWQMNGCICYAQKQPNNNSLYFAQPPTSSSTLSQIPWSHNQFEVVLQWTCGFYL